jgi:hypothetical protein
MREGLQEITFDRDIKLMKRAVVFAAGQPRPVESGTICEKCGQAGLAYYYKGKSRILVCDRINQSIFDFQMRRVEEWLLSEARMGSTPWYDDTKIGGAKIESIECGRDLYSHLRMRYCWFD